ncbi:MAG TPA: hypothetical protein VLY03_02810 [Bacteroidota bacterium]|nr:hypothetical protein [Bacteroidota bacterium]
MIQLVDEFFQMKNDPEQLSITPEIMDRLKRMHPSTMSERANDDGPVAWVLIFPTTHDLMKKFLEEQISEGILFEKTEPGITYDSIYLCSAIVLPEFRRTGLAENMTVEAVDNIRKDHPIRTLFYWAFSPEGDLLANAVGRKTSLPVYKRSE